MLSKESVLAFWTEYKKQLIFFPIGFLILRPVLESTWNFVSSIPGAIGDHFKSELVVGIAKLHLKYSNTDLFTITVMMLSVMILWIGIEVFSARIKTAENDEQKKYAKVMRTRCVIWLVLVFGGIIYDMYTSSILISQRLYIVDFQQNMTTLRPYIPHEQEKQIYSKWSQMKKMDDYIDIIDLITKIAKDNNIELPAKLHVRPEELAINKKMK